ncbi:hypothetical protein VTN31DRAFT_4365 [Thermomyces dupontii]|uniref:uncharacterized protein n=1 Tax=Talaromyces thermophilus TaxID=28565 RepID=UPI0037429A72
MSAPRPTLKLSFGKKKSPEDGASQGSPTAAESSAPTPQPKLTLKFSKPSGDKSKKKRDVKLADTAQKRRADDSSEDELQEEAPSTEQPGPKRLKLTSKKPGVKSLRLKHRGSIPERPLGVGYDSEASDAEQDPAMEEDFILRMVPGEDCEYIRQAINERRLDTAQIAFKALTREGRRAVLRVRDRLYAATLVDIPCIVEGLKSWDKRSFYKSADICQMLLVLGAIQDEKEALTYPLPKEVAVLDEKTYQYPHGLTPPLKYVRKRRFRNRVSTRTIEQAEKELRDILAKDNAALKPPKFELLDRSSVSRAEGVMQESEYEEEYDDMQDAEGEVDDELAQDGEGYDLEAFMEAELAAGAEEDGRETSETPAPPTAPEPTGDKGAESSGDESEESDREGGQDEDLDEEQEERKQYLQEQHDMIRELEQMVRIETERYESQTNSILKSKIAKRLQSLKQDLALKKASIGEKEADE